MTKQEFLAMSLPYGLKIKDSFSTPKLTGIMDNEYHFGDYLSIDGIEEVKPILRPLSDLTKPIEHKGKTFVPIEVLDGKNSGIVGGHELAQMLFEADYTIWDIKYATLQKLLEWKFDIADLISKGEAIDVNTLDINPYK